MQIPVLSLWQPWASLVVLKEKLIETRSWATSYRGLLAIHSTLRFTNEQQQLCNRSPFKEALEKHGFTPDNLPFGCVIGFCKLRDIMEIAHGYMAGIDHTTNETFIQGIPKGNERAFGDYRVGRYAWIMDDIRKLETPIKAIGRQGLWKWSVPEEVQTWLKAS